MNRRMGMFLWAALGLAGCSVVISTLILVLGYQGVAFLGSPTFSGPDGFGNVTNLSAAISTIFALVVSAIALLVVVLSERAETRTVEQLKIDVSSLWMTLHTLRNRALLYTNPGRVDVTKDLFETERASLGSIVSGPSGFALYLWQARTAEGARLDLTIEIAGLMDLLTLDLGQGDERSAVFTTIAHRADVIATGLSMSEADLRVMAGHLDGLGDGLTAAKEVASTDELGAFLADWRDREAADLALPSQAYVDQVLAAARDRIGGQADRTIQHFLDAARDGDRSALKNFYDLVRQLGLSDE